MNRRRYEVELDHFVNKILVRQKEEAEEYLAGFGLAIIPEFLEFATHYALKDFIYGGGVIYHGAQAIKRLGKPCLHMIIPYLQHPLYHYRRMAACLLGQLGYPEALLYLRECLKDENEKVRSEAKYAIENILKAENPSNFQN